MSSVANPMALFDEAWARAVKTAPAEPADLAAAMTLATADGAGRPSARVVLLRGVDEEGFLFYTNYASRKARELGINPHASLCLHWFWLEEQVRVEGAVVRATREESDAYFQSRPRESRVGAWASRQSQPLETRAQLEEDYRAFDQQFGDGPVPRPEFWGGFRLIPDRIEFWKAGAARLHDRVVYARLVDGWHVERLYP